MNSVNNETTLSIVNDVRMKFNNKSKLNLYGYTYANRTNYITTLNKDSKKMLEELSDKLRSYLVHSNFSLLRESFLNTRTAGKLKKAIQNFLTHEKESSIPNIDAVSLVNYFVDELSGFGVVQPLIENDNIEEIFINGPFDIRYTTTKEELLYTRTFSSHKELEKLVNRITSATGTTFNKSNQQVNCSIGRYRIYIEGEWITHNGISITIRRASKELRATPKKMLETNMVDKHLLDFLDACVTSGLNVLIGGETGSGKTELIRGLSGFHNNNTRIQTLEGERELNLKTLYPKKHIKEKTTHESNTRIGDITFDDLLLGTMRDRIGYTIFGEARGKEMVTMLEIFQSGEKGMATIHYSSIFEAANKIVMMVQKGVSMSQEAIFRQFAQAFHVLIFVKKNDVDKQRYLCQVGIVGAFNLETNNVDIHLLSKFNELYHVKDNENGSIKVIGKHLKMGNLPENIVEKFKDNNIPLEKYSYYLSEEQKNSNNSNIPTMTQDEYEKLLLIEQKIPV